RGAVTADFRGPTSTTLAPGKSHTFTLKRLEYGSRGASDAAYWTEEGEYTLSATLETGVSPIPKDAKEYRFDRAFGHVTLIGAPIKLKVVLKGKENQQQKQPAGPLELRLNLGKDTCTLDRGGLTAAEYLKKIKKTNKDGVFPPPAVDLTVEVRNTSNKEVQIWTGGDP